MNFYEKSISPKYNFQLFISCSLGTSAAVELYEKSSSPAFYIIFPRYERASLAKLYNLILVTIV